MAWCYWHLEIFWTPLKHSTHLKNHEIVCLQFLLIRSHVSKGSRDVNLSNIFTLSETDIAGDQWNQWAAMSPPRLTGALRSFSIVSRKEDLGEQRVDLKVRLVIWFQLGLQFWVIEPQQAFAGFSSYLHSYHTIPVFLQSCWREVMLWNSHAAVVWREHNRICNYSGYSFNNHRPFGGFKVATRL